MGCIWQEQHSWDYASWRGIKAFTVNTTEQPGMLWLENSRCSLKLPLSRAPLLFQLGFGGSPTSSPLLPNDSLQMPSLSPSTISFSSCQCRPSVGRRGHYCARSGPPLRRAKGTQTRLTAPDLEEPGGTTNRGCWAKAENTWCSFLALSIPNTLPR